VKGIKDRGKENKHHAHGYACNQTKKDEQQDAFGL